MLPLLDPLREPTLLSVILRFLLATVCGAVIGYERGRNLHAAGLRTHAVVCLGSASVMLLNEFLIMYYGTTSDPARLGAQVISGIGFLGAGTIVITGHQRGQQIKGLTTAASLWASACLGLVIGSGYYEAAIIMWVFLLVVIIALNRLNERYLKTSNVMNFYIEYSADIRFSSILDTLRQNHWHLTHIEYIQVNDDSVNGAIIDVQKSAIHADREGLLQVLRSSPGVLFVMES